MRAAVVRWSDGMVLNLIVADPAVDPSPEEGCYLISAEDGGAMGQVWDGAKFISPPSDATPDEPA